MIVSAQIHGNITHCKHNFSFQSPSIISISSSSSDSDFFLLGILSPPPRLVSGGWGDGPSSPTISPLSGGGPGTLESNSGNLSQLPFIFISIFLTTEFFDDFSLFHVFRFFLISSACVFFFMISSEFLPSFLSTRSGTCAMSVKSLFIDPSSSSFSSYLPFLHSFQYPFLL